MLTFHLGTEGIENPGKCLGKISMQGIDWLQKNKLINAGKYGHLPDAPESIPYFDDVILNFEQVKQMYIKFEKKAKEIRRTPGFKSIHMDTLESILLEALKVESGISTISD